MGNSYLSVHGTTRNLRVEYYVVKTYGAYGVAQQFKDTQLGKGDRTIRVAGGTRSPVVFTMAFSVGRRIGGRGKCGDGGV